MTTSQRFRTVLIVPLALLAMTSRLEAEETKLEGDIGRLQGRWTAKAGTKRKLIVTLDVRGKNAEVTIRTPQGLEIHSEGTLAINETTTPRSIDWVGFTSVDSQALPNIEAIYELNGDSFKVCNAGPNANRPVRFEKGDGILADIHVFERVKPDSIAQQTSSSVLANSSRSNRSR